MTKRKNPQIGPRFADWLKEEGIYEQATTASIKKVLAWQLEQAMKEHNLSKTEMARRMDTSRMQLDRLLDPRRYTGLAGGFVDRVVADARRVAG